MVSLFRNTEGFFKYSRWISNNGAGMLEVYPQIVQCPGPLGPEGATAMLAVFFILLLIACIAAPSLGVDTSDSRSESAHPAEGWFPALAPH